MSIETNNSPEINLVREYMRTKEALSFNQKAHELAIQIDEKLHAANADEKKSMREAISIVEHENNCAPGTIVRYISNIRNFEEFRQNMPSNLKDFQSLPAPEALSVYMSGTKVYVFACYDPYTALFAMNTNTGALSRIGNGYDSVADSQKRMELRSGTIAVIKGNSYEDARDGWMVNDTNGLGNRAIKFLNESGYTVSAVTGNRADILDPKYLASESLYYSRPLAERKKYQDMLVEQGKEIPDEPGNKEKALMLIHDLLKHEELSGDGITLLSKEFAKKLKEKSIDEIKQNMQEVIAEVCREYGIKYLYLTKSYIGKFETELARELRVPLEKALAAGNSNLSEVIEKELRYYQPKLVSRLERIGF